mmetsp:Transcript_16057/g.41539  ORF Transcript_16057/g.41539 Transcript_16057/m.41539 type:complete len:301 (+) Transcript_16057:634-1536(+)
MSTSAPRGITEPFARATSLASTRAVPRATTGWRRMASLTTALSSSHASGRSEAARAWRRCCCSFSCLASAYSAQAIVKAVVSCPAVCGGHRRRGRGRANGQHTRAQSVATPTTAAPLSCNLPGHQNDRDQASVEWRPPKSQPSPDRPGGRAPLRPTDEEHNDVRHLCLIGIVRRRVEEVDDGAICTVRRRCGPVCRQDALREGLHALHSHARFPHRRQRPCHVRAEGIEGLQESVLHRRHIEVRDDLACLVHGARVAQPRAADELHGHVEHRLVDVKHTTSAGKGLDVGGDPVLEYAHDL